MYSSIYIASTLRKYTLWSNVLEQSQTFGCFQVKNKRALRESGSLTPGPEAGTNGVSVSLFVWLWLIVNDRKFSAGTVFFSHTNQPTVLLHEPTTKRTSQPNRLTLTPNAHLDVFDPSY